ncbi:MAG: DUF11 domain-containing protein, partial [Chloroflexi bacterium]|nr:DUF11 domain-containing protein [Chloroflexota bacterium]
MKAYFRCILVAFIVVGAAGSGYADSVIGIDATVRSLVYCAATRTVYAGTPGSAGLTGNSIIPIDPVSGRVGKPLIVGSEPGQMVVSSDGHYLYVALDGANSIRQVDLRTWTAGPIYPIRARHMEPLPNSPQSIVISRGPGAGLGEGVAILDNGVPRAKGGSPNHFAVAYGGLRIYTYQNEISSWDFISYLQTSNGLFPTSSKNIFEGNVEIQGDGNGRIITNVEAIADPETHTILGKISGAGYADSIVPDCAVGRIFVLSGNKILIYDAARFIKLGSIDVPSGSTGLIRWGSDGFGMHTKDKVYLIRTGFVGPPLTPADLSVVETHTPAEPDINQPITYRLLVTNRGPGTATGVSVSDALPDGFDIVTETSSQGQAGFPNNVIAADLGTILPGRSATVTFAIRRNKAGTVPDVAAVRGDQPD